LKFQQKLADPWIARQLTINFWKLSGRGDVDLVGCKNCTPNTLLVNDDDEIERYIVALSKKSTFP
jgi:hypothetical protein